MQMLDITINDHPYSLACDDGQQDHITQLSEEVNMRAKEIARKMPSVKEPMILVMTCLMLADELYEARQEAGALHEKLARIDTHTPSQNETTNLFAMKEAQSTLAMAMDEVAGHIEHMAVSLEKSA